jgi:hypothetical protein
MKKLVLAVFVALLAVGLAAPPAGAVSLSAGDIKAHLNDASSLYVDHDTDGFAGTPRRPRGPRDFLATLTATDTSATIATEPTPAGWPLPVLDDAPSISDEERVLFELDSFENGTDAIVPDGELTGMMYDLHLIDIAVTATTAGGAPTDLALYYAPLGRNPLAGVPAGLPAGTGGVIEIYQDTSPEASGTGLYDPASDGLGPTYWVESSGVAGGRDAYPNVNVAPGAAAVDPGSSLWLSGVFLPLGTRTIGGVAVPYVKKETLNLEEGSGVIETLAVKIIGGSAAPVFVKNEFGPNIDLLGRADLVFPSDGLGGPLSPGIDPIDAGNSAYQGSHQDIGNWQVESSDPFQGAIIPEPATMSLLGMGLVGLVGAYYKRKKRV